MQKGKKTLFSLSTKTHLHNKEYDNIYLIIFEFAHVYAMREHVQAF